MPSEQTASATELGVDGVVNLDNSSTSGLYKETKIHVDAKACHEKHQSSNPPAANSSPSDYKVSSTSTGTAAHRTGGMASRYIYDSTNFPEAEKLQPDFRYLKKSADDGEFHLKNPSPTYNYTKLCSEHDPKGRSSSGTSKTDKPEKYPITTSEYQKRGFAPKYDRNRHLVTTRYEPWLICGFCRNTISLAPKGFSGKDAFKRHLITTHQVEQHLPKLKKDSPQHSRRQSVVLPEGISGRCSICGQVFATPQELFDHLDDCVLPVATQIHPAGEASETEDIKVKASSGETSKDDQSSQVPKILVHAATCSLENNSSVGKDSKLEVSLRSKDDGLAGLSPTTSSSVAKLSIESKGMRNDTLHDDCSSISTDYSTGDETDFGDFDGDHDTGSSRNNKTSEQVQSWRAGVTTCANGHNESTSNGRPKRKSAPPGRRRDNSKRQRLEGNDSKSGDEGEEDDQRRSAGDSSSLRTIDDNLRFACPFHKHDPVIYSGTNCLLYRACSGPGWRSFKDVKNHIVRRHKAPIYCDRCFEEFLTENLKSEHFRQELTCEKKAKRHIPGVTKEHRDRIQCELRKCSTEMERWIEMYKILFGDDKDVPHPYYADQAEPTPIWFLEDQCCERLPTIVPQGVSEAMRTCLESRQSPMVVPDSFSSILSEVLTKKLDNLLRTLCDEWEAGHTETLEPTESPQAQTEPIQAQHDLPNTLDEVPARNDRYYGASFNLLPTNQGWDEDNELQFIDYSPTPEDDQNNMGFSGSNGSNGSSYDQMAENVVLQTIPGMAEEGVQVVDDFSESVEAYQYIPASPSILDPNLTEGFENLF